MAFIFYYHGWNHNLESITVGRDFFDTCSEKKMSLQNNHLLT